MGRFLAVVLLTVCFALLGTSSTARATVNTGDHGGVCAKYANCVTGCGDAYGGIGCRILHWIVGGESCADQYAKCTQKCKDESPRCGPTDAGPQ